MKFIIRQILIALTLIAIINESQCEREIRKFRLSRVFENIIKNFNRTYNNEAENEVGRTFNVDCARNYFKLPQNGNMILKGLEELLFMIASAFKCSSEEKAFETITSKFIDKGMGENLNCLKWYLKQHEPSSKLIDNFESNDADKNKCQEQFPIYFELTHLVQGIEDMFGPLKAYSCGAISEDGANDMVIFIAKGAIIDYGNINEELKTSEKEALKIYLRDVVLNTVDCIFKRFEDDPKGQCLFFEVMMVNGLNLKSQFLRLNHNF